MQCPKCRSNQLMIRNNTGFERLVILFTGGLREYRCRECDQRFRAPDRRKIQRYAAGATALGKLVRF